MLADDRSKALVDNFFAQWLQLRAAHGQAPDPNVFPEFDENLREAFIQETELFLESQLREDRSVLDLLTANYTFLNERLAQHYQIPGVYGSRFRRVTHTDERRGGLLGHGQRPDGHVLWQSDVAGAAGEVGAREHPRHAAAAAAGRRAAVPTRGRRRRRSRDRSASVSRSIARIRRARTATRRWIRSASRSRTSMRSASGARSMPTRRSTRPACSSTARRSRDPPNCDRCCFERRQQVVRTVTEKLLTYAVGRGLESYDAPVVRRISRAGGSR